MTLTTKRIRGNEYHYYQDSVSNKERTVLTTCICRVDEDGTKVSSLRRDAAARHIAKLIPHIRASYRQYGFRNVSQTGPEGRPANDMPKLLDLLRLVYRMHRSLLSREEISDFESELFARYAHGTTAIEGNTLSEGEARRLLLADLTPQNKTLNETLEVANYVMVRKYMRHAGPVTERMLKRVHGLMLAGIRRDDGRLINTGSYRTGQVMLKGIAFRPPVAEQVPSRLGYLLADYEGMIAGMTHPVEAASYFHQKFEEIHPFEDGNGRAGREILNHMLVRGGFPPVCIMPEQRSAYLEALYQGNGEEFQPLLEFIVHQMCETVAHMAAYTGLHDALARPEVLKAFEKAGMADGYLRIVQMASQASQTYGSP